MNSATAEKTLIEPGADTVQSSAEAVAPATTTTSEPRYHGFALTAVAVYAIGHAAGNLALLVVVVFVAGTLMNTSQSSLPALAAGFYPTQGRATGVAWMLGLGRFGGIAGSFLVAELAHRQLTFSQIFTIVAIPGLIAAAALMIKQLAHPEVRRDPATGETTRVLVHRWCRPGRSPRSTSYALADA